jgi:hypothetical protein
MNGYIKDLLIIYDHPTPAKLQHLPHQHREIICGTKEQLLPNDDNSPLLDDAGVKCVQGIIGSLLYYARATNNKLLATLSLLSSQQAHATKNTETSPVAQVLDYIATNPANGITYQASSISHIITTRHFNLEYTAATLKLTPVLHKLMLSLLAVLILIPCQLASSATHSNITPLLGMHVPIQDELIQLQPSSEEL